VTTPHQPTDYPLPNGALLEASAGTGKTYAVAAYVTLAIASDESLRIGDILVTTYTRNAAAELRDRIRGRLVATARLLRGHDVAGHDSDGLDDALRADEADRLAKARRLERAVAEFDTATIGTIHSICARVLRLAGVQAADTGDEQLLDRVIDEVVNDAVVAEAAADPPCRWPEKPLAQLVRARLGDPFIELFDGGGRTAEAQAAITRAIGIVEACVARVQERMRSSPSFDDLLRRAWEAVQGDAPQAVAFREDLRRRFRIGIVDEAQDTSRLQWEFLHAIFPPGNDPDVESDDDRKEKLRHLIAVGDPKQAIYGFRGADVTAYLRFASPGAATSRRTLTTNYRSDGPLVTGLDRLMAGATFGPDIAYQQVTPAPGREASRLVGLQPVELLDLGAVSLADAAVCKVHALLTSPVCGADDGRPFRPGAVCVLVRVNATGARIERGLTALGIPAVITGTASVMVGQMAEDIRVLLEAMERPSSLGRARRAAATVLFGHTLAEVGRLEEHALQVIQDRIAALHGVLQRAGFAAVAAEVMGDETLAGRLAAGPDGERRIVDFAHVGELLQEASGGQGCHARRMLELFAELATRDEKGDLVSRRVESDDDAVKIMSIHAAKGLEFPCVVVADLWNPSKKVRKPTAFYRDDIRLLDAGHAVAGAGIAKESEQAILAAAREELSRLFYVAVTRPRHHLCILRPNGWKESLLGDALPGAPATAADIAAEDHDIVAVRPAADLPPARGWSPPADTFDAVGDPDITPLPERVERTVLRTSFSGITGAATRRKVDRHAAEASGNDEDLPGGDDAPTGNDMVAAAADDGTAATLDGEPMADPAAVASFTIADLPAGRAFGNVVHDILEHVEPPPEPEPAAVAAAVHAVVTERATSRLVASHRESLTALLTDALFTPFGGPALFAERRFVDFPATARLPEMDFEMAVAGIARGVLASDVGRVLLAKNMLPAADPLRAYAERIASEAFDVPLAGLFNGTIDAVLLLPGRPVDDPRLLIADYKTNRLHGRDDPHPLQAYAPARLTAAMAHGDYPLQALVYGTAVYRMLRWRLGHTKPAGWDPGECIAGVVYGFLRGMKGADTPVDSAGGRYGVFTWQPPAGIWRRLSDLLAGDREGLPDA
jgi:exodeoxyribonuclease V beta subunit